MRNRIIVLCSTWCLSVLLMGVSQAAALRGNNEHARKWNKFADDTLALHNRLIKQQPTTVKTRTGGYFQDENFYKEEAYYDANNRLISRVQWETEQPEIMHSIEVFVRDAQGRVTRDYIAAYLPRYHNAPTQTLVSLHQYNDKLHAFRTFDASGARIVERCTGQFKGKEVNMLLDEDEIAAALEGRSKDMQQPVYKACFKGLPEKPGKHLQPQ